MPRVVVEVPSDRTKIGTIRLLADNGILIVGPFSVFAKADNRTASRNGNPSRNPLFPFGDTPTGRYRVPGLEATGPNTSRNAHSYGPHGAIRLDPTEGDAAVAKGLGREYLLIHGGDPNTAGLLRPTNGCIRLSNDDMRTLVAAIVAESQLSGPTSSCSLDTVEVEVGSPAGGLDDDYNEGDPPPQAPPMP
jgi:hypothetical protein